MVALAAQDHKAQIRQGLVQEAMAGLELLATLLDRPFTSVVAVEAEPQTGVQLTQEETVGLVGVAQVPPTQEARILMQPQDLPIPVVAVVVVTTQITDLGNQGAPE